MRFAGPDELRGEGPIIQALRPPRSPSLEGRAVDQMGALTRMGDMKGSGIVGRDEADLLDREFVIGGEVEERGDVVERPDKLPVLRQRLPDRDIPFPTRIHCEAEQKGRPVEKTRFQQVIPKMRRADAIGVGFKRRSHELEGILSAIDEGFLAGGRNFDKPQVLIEERRGAQVTPHNREASVEGSPLLIALEK